MVGLGFLSLTGAKIESKVTGISPDGSRVVGESEGDNGKETFIWDEENGMRSLRDALEADLGVDLTGWSFGKEVSFSSDGSTLVVVATDPEGVKHVTVATSEPEPAMTGPLSS